MEQTVATKQGRVFVVLNPVAGTSAPADVRQTLETLFTEHGRQCSVYETSGDDDALAAEMAQVRQDGYDLVVAAGGDGTVSLVASNLVGSDIPLGVLPVGTANVLALELGIPQTLEQAAALLVEDHQVRELDVMRLGERHFILQIGIGLDSLMIKDTSRQAKRLFGRLAYMTTLLGKLFGYRSQRFTMLVDGKRMRPRAWQVLVANAGTLGAPPFRWGPDIHPTDGELDLCIFNVRTPMDYARILWRFVTGRHKHGPNISYVRVRNQAIITTDRPLPVQADGEIIGETPVQVAVVPRGIAVIVPPNTEPAAAVDVAHEASKDDE